MRLSTALIFVGLLGCSNPVKEVPITVDFTNYSFKNKDGHGVFWGEVYNYGDENLVGLYPIVHYENNGIAVSDTGRVYRNFDRGIGPYFEMSSLRSGEDGYWSARSSVPLETPPEYEVEFELK